MKKILPFVLLALGVLYVASSVSALRNPSKHTDFDIVGFGKLPVVTNGRVKPLDTVARTAILLFQGRQRVAIPESMATAERSSITPAEWLLDVVFNPEKADQYRTFEIVHPELLSVFSLQPEDGDGKKRFSFNQLEPALKEIERQASLARPVEPAVRTPFQKAVVQLHSNLVHYQQLQYSLISPGSDDFLADLTRFHSGLEKGVEAVRAKQAGREHDEVAARSMIELGQHFIQMSNFGLLLAVPPAEGEGHAESWKNVGNSLLESFQTGQVNPYVMTYAGLARTWRAGQAKEFNHIIDLYGAQLAKNFPETLKKGTAELRFNAAAPFSKSMNLYVLGFVLALFSWLKWPDVLGRSAFWLIALAWVLSTVGILTRMWLEGRPPVTNLYSSALFVGWGAVGLCLVLEATFRNAVGSVAAGMIGFATLLIAHHLSLAGDTLEMMRAVLDSNFWLATHVVVVSAGYSATFLAGFLAIIYVIRGVLTRSLDKGTADALARMVYGIVCFATLFSFAGTVLGGIWADQSWGRFWGWDPKENGALIIVIWNAVILHARWGGMVKQRGLMSLAIFGNIVTSWSWFGTNMLGVGLHSYGFTDAAFVALSGFVASQLLLIGIANLPL
ncbi:MAG TPA: cytochrome c biogenesis protein CcsA, partial [Opitutus sp.]|nr:cytochrome c biogenesis protein CcsA [Opitutus sp.]